MTAREPRSKTDLVDELLLGHRAQHLPSTDLGGSHETAHVHARLRVPKAAHLQEARSHGRSVVGRGGMGAAARVSREVAHLDLAADARLS